MERCRSGSSICFTCLCFFSLIRCVFFPLWVGGKDGVRSGSGRVCFVLGSWKEVWAAEEGQKTIAIADARVSVVVWMCVPNRCLSCRALANFRRWPLPRAVKEAYPSSRLCKFSASHSFSPSPFRRLLIGIGRNIGRVWVGCRLS